MSSPEASAKFLTKFNGFLISWATPAVSSPRAASFSRVTIWSWALCSSARTPSSSSFLPCNSSASCSTRLRRCTSRAWRRNTSSVAAMSATSSRPLIGTITSRSPPAIRRIQSDSRPMRRTRTLPTNSQTIRSAPRTLTALIASRIDRAVVMACSDAAVASAARAWESRTRSSTSSTSVRASSLFWTSSSSLRSRIANSLAARLKELLVPSPNSSIREKMGAASAWNRVPASVAKFRWIRLAATSNRSLSGSSRLSSERVNAVASRSEAMLASASNSARRRYRNTSASEKCSDRATGGSSNSM